MLLRVAETLLEGDAGKRMWFEKHVQQDGMRYFEIYRFTAISFSAFEFRQTFEKFLVDRQPNGILGDAFNPACRYYLVAFSKPAVSLDSFL